jgi:hypothetical protein
MNEYGMFTDQGDALIDDLVIFANKYQLNDKSINAMLWAISENETFSEASDTVVRGNVFDKLNQFFFLKETA